MLITIPKKLLAKYCLEEICWHFYWNSDHMDIYPNGCVYKTWPHKYHWKPPMLLVDLRYVVTFHFHFYARLPSHTQRSILIAHSCREGKRRAERERAVGFVLSCVLSFGVCRSHDLLKDRCYTLYFFPISSFYGWEDYKISWFDATQQQEWNIVTTVESDKFCR